MLKISCLVKNTQLVEDLKTLVEFLGFQKAADSGQASLMSVYSDVRKLGIEIDLKSVGTIYADVLPLDEEGFNTLDEIEDMTGSNFNGLLNALVNQLPRQGAETIGAMSSEEFVASGLAAAFYTANSVDEKTKSIMVTMQNALYKGANRLLGQLPATPKSKEDWLQTVDRALSYNEMGYTDVAGRLNNMQDLFNAFKAEMKKYTDAINGTDADFVKAQWAEYVEGLENSAYTLLFSKKEAKKVLTDMMKDAGFGKKLSNGNTIIDWVKLSGGINNVDDLRNNVERVLDDNGFRGDVIRSMKNSLANEFNDMYAEILNKADKNLSNRAKDKKVVKKADIKRLAELHGLGVFGGAHEKVMYKLLGVDSLTRADMNSLKDISNSVTGLYKELEKENLGKELYSSYGFQQMQHSVSRIVHDHFNNKTKMLQVVDKANKFLQLRAVGLIMNVYNMMENNWSAYKELLATNIQVVKQRGFSEAFKDKDVFWSVMKDVSNGGVRYGDDSGKFGHINSVEDSINKKNTLSKKLLYFLMTPARMFLTGSDSAYKATITHKIFQLNLHKALMQKGMSKEEANDFMNEALYGQKKEEAKVLAEKMLSKFGLSTKPESVSRLANDLVKANLNSNQLVTEDMIQAAFNSAYNVAAIGMGHASQNGVLSMPARRLEAQRKAAAVDEKKLIKDEDWNKLASHRAVNSLWNNVISVFVGGQINWMVLKLQGMGFGIATGLMGKYNADIDFADKDSLEKTMFDHRNANQQISRAVVGLSVFSVISGIMAAILYGTGDDDDKTSELEEMYAHIKKDYVLSKIFKKNAPELILQDYYRKTAKNQGTGLMQFGQNFFNLGNNYSIPGRFTEASKNLYKGEQDRALGQAGQYLGSTVDMPMWRSYKSYWQIVQWGAASAGLGNKPTSDYKDPDTFVNGLMGGSVLEDLGLFSRQNPALDALPVIGEKSKAYLKTKGINSIDDFQKSDWRNMKDSKGHKMFSEKEQDKLGEALKQY